MTPEGDAVGGGAAGGPGPGGGSGGSGGSGGRGGSGARVVSVNVGRPRQFVHHGRVRTSAIWKDPVDEHLAVRRDNVEGDAQADLSVHGGPSKAVYAYAAQDYDWWSSELGTELGPGTFGENLTTTGVDLSGLLVGERLRVGGAVLQVVQPRFPCWKLGVRMDDPKFPGRFLAAGRAGAYFSVAGEGELGRGDAIVGVYRPEHPVTIGLIAYLNDADRNLAKVLLRAVEDGLGEEAWAEIVSGIDLPPASTLTT